MLIPKTQIAKVYQLKLTRFSRLFNIPTQSESDVIRIKMYSNKINATPPAYKEQYI